MILETESKRRGTFVTAVLPWVLGGGMFVFFAVTCYREASPNSLGRLAQISGWDWRPQLFAPLTYLITAPIGWLPAGLRLYALNLLAAGCAGLVLVLLARSIALLPHDRTNEQRQRELSENSLLSTPMAWLPPLFAVLVCGFQISFWERAVEFVDNSLLDNAEMVNLVLFAYVIRCLMEFRVSGKESWLTRCALVVGLGMANDWAMIGYLPLFVIALVWIKGFDFFQWRFLGKMLAFGFGGLLLLLLLPLVIHFQHFLGYGFWQALRQLLAADRSALRHPEFDYKMLLLISLTSILPLLLIGIRWANSFGDNSRVGVFFASSAITLAYGVFLLCCLWMVLDPLFGPRQWIPGGVVHLPMLTFFYIGALCAGYFLGYFLLVFGTRPSRQRERTPPVQSWFSRVVLALTVLVAVAAPVVLLRNNAPRIQAGRSAASALDRYFSRVEQLLPSQDAVILSDKPAMLFDLRAVQARQHAVRSDIFLDTSSLGDHRAAVAWNYLAFLEKSRPEENLGGVFNNRGTQAVQDSDCIHLLEQLGSRHEIYYLQPSYGYYFERFYPEPHGYAYRMREYPANAWSPPALDPSLIADNEAFWKDCSNDIASLIVAMNPKRMPPTNGWERFAQKAFFAPETNEVQMELAQLYSRGLDFWGVELQRCTNAGTNALAQAGGYFDLARQLNGLNWPALINEGFNRDLREGKQAQIKSLSAFEDQLPGGYAQWFDSVNAGGPFDEPNFCLGFGALLTEGSNFRQAIQQFQRAEQLLPGHLSPPLLLAQTYSLIPGRESALDYALPSPGADFYDATVAADRALKISPDETNALYLKEFCLLQLGEYLQGHSNETARPFPSAQEAYSGSLEAADHLLRVVPNEPGSLFYKSLALMQLDRPCDAIPFLTHLIETQTNNIPLYFTRAVGYFQCHKFDSAKADYETLLKANPPGLFKVYFGLGEIAYTNRDYPEALKNYQLYLTNAPTEWQATAEFKNVQQRVGDLRKTQ